MKKLHYYLYGINKLLGKSGLYSRLILKMGWDSTFIKQHYKHLNYTNSKALNDTEVDGYYGSDADETIIPQLITNMLSVNPRPANILDIGCGSGRYLKELHKVLPQSQLTAIDISSSTLENYTQKNAPSALLYTVDIETDASFADTHKEQFDLVYMNSIIQILSVSNISNTLNKLYNVLAPGGLLYIQFPIETETKKSSLGFKRYTPQELEAYLKKTGYTVVKAERLHALKDFAYIFAQK